MDYDQQFWRAQHGQGFWQAYQREDLQENSRALVDAISEHCDLGEDVWLHEMGANIGRNLHYIAQRFPTWTLSANDINPLAPAQCRQAYPGLFEKLQAYSVRASQDWLDAVEGQPDVVVSSDHFIHIEDLTPFVARLPGIVGRYLVLRESAGLNAPGSDYYRYWTTGRERRGLSRWFDHDCAAAFENTTLELIHRQRQRVYHDSVMVDGQAQSAQRAYDIYIFEQTGVVS